MHTLIFQTADDGTNIVVNGDTIIKLVVELLTQLHAGGIDLEEVQEVNIIETALKAYHSPIGAANFFDYEPSESFTITVG